MISNESIYRARKFTPELVKTIRTEFKKGFKISTIIKKHSDVLAGISRTNISLVLHNHLWADPVYGKWLKENVVTRYTKIAEHA